MKFAALMILGFVAFISSAKADDLQTQYNDGFAALKEIGFTPEEMSARSVREAGLLKAYQAAWNEPDTTITDASKLTNPDQIVEKYTDGPGLTYRDICLPNGAHSKAALKQYLVILYTKFPRQTWGNGWKNIHLFKGAKPGEWSYYYEFTMSKSMDKNAKPDLAGTGIERVQFDDQGKLISDEVHLIISSGVATCKFGSAQ